MLKSLTIHIFLLSTVLIVLIGSEAMIRIIEVCAEKSVSIDMEIENDLEDDFEDDVKLKTFFQKDLQLIHHSYLENLRNTFVFIECSTHNDLTFIFAPPPDIFSC